MASIIKRSNGTREIRVVRDDRRLMVHLGDCPAKTAASVKFHVERLAVARASNGTLPDDTARWLAGIDDTIYDRLARAGLVEPRASRADAAMTVLAYVDRYIDRRRDVSEATRTKWRQTRERLREHVGDRVTLAGFKQAAAADFKAALIAAKLAPSTWGKLVKIARMIFADAVDRGLIDRNPFAKVKGHGQANRERIKYVGPATINKVLDATGDAERRLIVSLSRYAGLRCPSEPLRLRWADVNWQERRLLVRSGKTAGHGKTARTVPIDPRLMPMLLDAFERCEPGQTNVVPAARLRGAGVNLRTALLRACDRAGVAPWPRLFHNLRASCIVDWAERLPAHAVAEFAGNTAAIAAAHYLAPMAAHYAIVAGEADPETTHQNPHQSGPKTAHQMTHQHAAASARTDARSPDFFGPECESSPDCATSCDAERWPQGTRT